MKKNISLKGIIIILSYGCNAKCEHCFYPHTDNTVIDTSMVRDAILGVTSIAPLEWLHISGGEPFLHECELLETIRIARKAGITNIGAVTNGFWASDMQKAISLISRLTEAGLTGLSVSADAFHEPFVPLANVRCIDHSLRLSGMKGHSFIVSAHADGEKERRTGEIKRELGDTYLPWADPVVRGIGRGVDESSTHESLDGPCTDLSECLGEKAFDPEMVYLDPYGNVLICHGLSIGSVHEHPLAEIISRFDPDAYDVIGALSRGGPAAVYDMAVTHGYAVPKENHRTKCQLCYASRAAMVQRYPRELTPAICYSDAGRVS